MQERQVLERAFAMPLTSPAYPPGPYLSLSQIQSAGS
jgi:acetoacetate decarboxylase